MFIQVVRNEPDKTFPALRKLSPEGVVKVKIGEHENEDGSSSRKDTLTISEADCNSSNFAVETK